MSGFKGHLIFAIVFVTLVWVVNQFFFTFFKTTKFTALIIYLPIILLGALMPDLDSQSSKITVLFTAVFIILAIWSITRGLTGRGIGLLILVAALWFGFLTKTIKHRGFFHTFAFGAILGVLVIFLINLFAGVLFFIAFSSHLILDRLTGGKNKLRLF